MKYKIADLMVEYDAKYDRLQSRSKKYEMNTKEGNNIQLAVEKINVQKYMERYENASEEDAEYMIIGQKFYKQLLNFNGCMLHSSAVVVDDEAYLFSANSGVGKSTHTGLWLKYLADKNPYILNDDKPALRVENGEVYSYGTPFSGKHDMSENKKVKVKGICFIKRSKDNRIERIESLETIPLFWKQTLKKLTSDEVNKLFDVLEVIIEKVPIYKLCCDMSEEAVQLAYTTMKGETNES